jgi:CBS domain-containing protein
MTVRNSTPLIALDGLVLDTETTGLDPAVARIVEIGAVGLAGGRVQPADTLHALVRPGAPVPAAATAIHGIDDARVADAPTFAAVWPKLRERIGASVVVGHNLGFDLAVLRRECERAKLPFDMPRALDTRLLAQVVEPNLSGYTLEGLSAWLGIKPERRHSALGDAATTARIFTALVPRLRDSGVRTLGEAMRACRALSVVLDEQHRAGWEDTAQVPTASEGADALGRIDSYPYRHRVRDVMRSPAQFVDAGTPVGQALTRLMEQRISSLYVSPAAGGATRLPPALSPNATCCARSRDTAPRRSTCRYRC